MHTPDHKLPRRSRRWVLWLCFVLVVVIALIGWAAILQSYVSAPGASVAITAQTAAPVSASSKTLFFRSPALVNLVARITTRGLPD